MSSWLGEHDSGGFSLSNRRCGFPCWPSSALAFLRAGGFVSGSVAGTPEMLNHSTCSVLCSAVSCSVLLCRHQCPAGIWAHPLQEPWHEPAQHSPAWQTALANWELIKQLIKFHLVHFPCNKPLILSEWECSEHSSRRGGNGRGGCESKATHTVLQWQEQHSSSRARGEVRRKWWALMVTSLTGSLLFQHTAQHLSASADSRELPLRWLIIKMGWKLFRTLCLQNNSKK